MKIVEILKDKEIQKTLDLILNTLLRTFVCIGVYAIIILLLWLLSHNGTIQINLGHK